jgi:hypothetical protein
MRKIIFVAAALALLPRAALADTYALVLTAPGQVQSTDAQGNPTVITAQPGYVVDIIVYDGQSPYAPPAGTEIKPAGNLKIGDITTP